MVRGRTRSAEPETVEEVVKEVVKDNGLNLKALKEKKIGDLALIGKTSTSKAPPICASRS